MYSGCSSLRSRPDAASESQKLADLVITDISQSEYYIVVHYINLGGTASQGDFLVKVSADGKSFNGNSYYRFRIPEPRKPTKTGGFTKGLIGLKTGMTAVVTAEIDREDRVNEKAMKTITSSRSISL